MHWSISGARAKRGFLSFLGRRQARHQLSDGFPGCGWLIGITDPRCVNDPNFFHRWLLNVPGQFVELTCHPGEFDSTLDGRDGSFSDGQLHRRATELDLLRNSNFLASVKEAGFTLVPPSFFREQESGDRGQRTGNRGQETGDRRHGTGDRGQGTGVNDAA